MKTTPQYCRFNDGSVILPEGYQDRTVNVFISAQPAAAGVNISRDILADGETAAAYIDRQLLLLDQQLTDWKLQERQPVCWAINCYLVSVRSQTIATIAAESGSNRRYLLSGRRSCWCLP